MRRYLIVGNQTLAGGHLSAKVRELSERRPSSFYIVVPATPPHGHSWSEGEARDIARRRLETALALLRGVGVEAEGEVGDERPTYAIQDVLAHRAFDEIIALNIRHLLVAFLSGQDDDPVIVHLRSRGLNIADLRSVDGVPDETDVIPTDKHAGPFWHHQAYGLLLQALQRSHLVN